MLFGDTPVNQVRHRAYHIASRLDPGAVIARALLFFYDADHDVGVTSAVSSPDNQDTHISTHVGRASGFVVALGAQESSSGSLCSLWRLQAQLSVHRP